MVIIAIHLVVIRYLSEVHHGVGNLIVMVWGLVQGVILSWAFGHLEIPPFDDILGLSISGLCLGLAMTFLVLALQNEEAGVVALVRTSEVIFVFFWQWVIVGTQPDIIRYSFIDSQFRDLINTIQNLLVSPSISAWWEQLW